jgi:hypothetical protein
VVKSVIFPFFGFLSDVIRLGLFRVDYIQSFQLRHYQEVSVGADESVNSSAPSKVEGNGELERVECSEALAWSVFSYKAFRFLIVKPGHTRDLQNAGGKLGQKAASHALEVRQRNRPTPYFSCKHGQHFDGAKPGNVMLRAWLQKKRFHLRASHLDVVVFSERTGVKEIVRHLPLIPLGDEVLGHGAGDFR